MTQTYKENFCLACAASSACFDAETKTLARAIARYFGESRDDAFICLTRFTLAIVRETVPVRAGLRSCQPSLQLFEAETIRRARRSRFAETTSQRKTQRPNPRLESKVASTWASQACAISTRHF